MKLAHVSNEELLSDLHVLVGQGRVLLARLLAYLGELEQRRLDLKSACSSLFDFCIRKLRMSEDEAYRRVTASRLARRFPLALGMIERGELHLTALLLLREHLTEDNHDELLRAAANKTKAQVQELLSERFPRPDVPSQIQALPGPTTSPPAIAAPGAVPTRNTAHVQPLSPERFMVQFTATADLKKKIEHVANLMRHSNPSGDLSLIVERALDLLILQAEKRRLGKASHPRKQTPRTTRPGYVTRAVRREVVARDGAQCTYTDETGQRCESRAFLELDHRTPRARGGSDEASNLRLLCKAHNALCAEREFGREHIERKKAERHQRSANHPRQRGSDSETALRALTAMGFKQQQARHALELVEERCTGRPPSLEGILRSSLAILT